MGVVAPGEKKNRLSSDIDSNRTKMSRGISLMALTGKAERQVRGIKPVETFLCHLQSLLEFAQ